MKRAMPLLPWKIPCVDRIFPGTQVPDFRSTMKHSRTLEPECDLVVDGMRPRGYLNLISWLTGRGIVVAPDG